MSSPHCGSPRVWRSISRKATKQLAFVRYCRLVRSGILPSRPHRSTMSENLTGSPLVLVADQTSGEAINGFSPPSYEVGDFLQPSQIRMSRHYPPERRLVPGYPSASFCDLFLKSCDDSRGAVARDAAILGLQTRHQVLLADHRQQIVGDDNAHPLHALFGRDEPHLCHPHSLSSPPRRSAASEDAICTPILHPFGAHKGQKCWGSRVSAAFNGAGVERTLVTGERARRLTHALLRASSGR